MNGTDTLSREDQGLSVLLACVTAAERWAPLARGCREALGRAHRDAPPGRAPRLAIGTHATTAAALVRHGLVHDDGRLTQLGVEVTAWSMWMARGDGLDEALDVAVRAGGTR